MSVVGVAARNSKKCQRPPPRKKIHLASTVFGISSIEGLARPPVCVGVSPVL